jgi:hypothetical protein
LKTFRLENHILRIIDLPIIILMVIVEFNLFMVFSLFSKFLGNIFTLDKFFYIFSFIVLLLHFFIYRSRYIKKLLPYLKYYLGFLVFVTISNILNTSPLDFKQLFQIYGPIAFSFCFIIVIRSLGLLKLFFYTGSVIAILISFLQLTKSVQLNDFSGQNTRASQIEKYIQDDRFAGIAGNSRSLIKERGQFLWISSNNLAYLLSPYLIFMLYILLATRVSIMIKVVALFGLPLLFVSIISTTSRGGLLVTLIGIIIFFKLINVIKLKNIIYILLMLLMLPILLLSLKNYSGFNNIVNKSSTIFKAVQTRNINEMEGVALGRLATAYLAVEDIKKKPMFGWGHKKIIGIAPGTDSRNHVSYLKTIGEVGIAGFLCLIILFSKSIKGTINSINIFKTKNNVNYKFGYFLITLLFMFLISGFFQPSNSILYFSRILIVYIFCTKQFDNFSIIQV